MGLVLMAGPYPYHYHPIDAEFSGAWHSDYSADDPTYIAATQAPATTLLGGFMNPIRSGYSTDGGYNWNAFAAIPLNSNSSQSTFGQGSIHVGQPGHIIWVSAWSKGTQRTTDHGATWSAVSIPGVTMSSLNIQANFYYRRPIASEKTAGSADTFYAHAPGVGIFVSTDAGASWTQQCNNTPFGSFNWTQHAYIKTVYGHPGHLFDTPGYQGTPTNPALGLPFKRSTDGGVTWSTVTTMDTVRGFDFGLGGPGSTYPAIYAVGRSGGVIGVHRSDDNCASWTLLSPQPNNTVDLIRNVGASKDVYGKHWITTAGSGLIVGTLT